MDVIHLYLKAGDARAAGRLLPRIVEPMLAGREEERLLELVNEVLERDPEQVEALRTLVRVYWWQRETEKLRAALERLVEAAEAAHLVEDERAALAQLVRLVPDQSKYLERLRELGGAPVELEEEALRGEEMNEEIPTFESFTMTNDESSEATTRETVQESEYHEAAATATDGVRAEAEQTTPSADFSFADLNEDWTDTHAGSAPASLENSSGEQTFGNEFQEFNLGFEPNEATRASQAPTVVETSAPAAAPLDARREAMLRQELDSVDFYLAQGYTDIALDTLEMLERQFGANPRIDARRQQLQSTASSAPHNAEVSANAPTEAVEFSNFSLYDVAEEQSPATSEAAQADDFLLTFDNAAKSHSQVAAPPTHAPTQPAARVPEVHPELAALFDEFRTAAEEDEPASNGDYETHYNLGLAYKEMDLMEEAVEEFQIAVNLAAPRDGTARYLHCCNLLGHCFMQKGMPRLAITWFNKGLDAPGHTADEYLALRFELGTAYEQLGDLDRAIDIFTEIYGVNVSYRGVSAKLNELQAQKTSG